MLNDNIEMLSRFQSSSWDAKKNCEDRIALVQRIAYMLRADAFPLIAGARYRMRVYGNKGKDLMHTNHDNTVQEHEFRQGVTPEIQNVHANDLLDFASDE